MTSPIRKDATYGLALARGGSRGLRRKNVRSLGGHPLIAWAVGLGTAAASVDRVLCSTDDVEIATAAFRYGAEVPFRRPVEHASDTATDLDVFAHLIGWLTEHEGELPEFLVQLRPTTPFREPAWIDLAVEMMRTDRSITCVRSVAPAPLTPYKMWRDVGGGRLEPLLSVPGIAEPFNMPRQALPTVWWHTGQLDVIRTEVLLAGSMTGSNIHALRVDVDTAVDIDHAVDFHLAELVFAERMPKIMIDHLAAAATAHPQAPVPAPFVEGPSR